MDHELAIYRTSEPPRDEAGLERLLAECRTFSAEFPDFLANHLPMVLVAMHRLGGSDARMAAFFETYRDAHRLPPPPPRVAAITSESWGEFLGDRSRELDYIDFFRSEIRRHGPRSIVAGYLPSLVPGVAASATHGLMRLAYGVMREDGEEIATALGYWSATYLMLGRAGDGAPVTDDPVQILMEMRAPAFHGVETELNLLWHFMRAIAGKPEFRPIVDALTIRPETARRMREASLALFAGTMDFCALHAVTGGHWLRMLARGAPIPEIALRYFWQAIASLYPKMGFPDVPSPEMLEHWRRLPCPEWPEIAAAAVASDDEHDLSLTFSAREEERMFGDRLYRVVAARQVRLIA
jgi:hypothetical protein